MADAVLTGDWTRDGLLHLPWDRQVAAWAEAAAAVAASLPIPPDDLRHGGTWRVGVDALPNPPDGSIGSVPLGGAWARFVEVPDIWHKAQLSVVYPGYPRQDPDEGDAAHRYRLRRDAAHVDGLLPEGPARRRHLREPHAFILGLPLTVSAGSPLVVWQGSHVVMRAAFAEAFHGHDPQTWGDLDVTEVYQTARRRVFETCARVTLPAKPGEATLLHRLTLHGVAPWGDAPALAAGRMIAYFRPQLSEPARWLTDP